MASAISAVRHSAGREVPGRNGRRDPRRWRPDPGCVELHELLRHVWAFAVAESCRACSPCRVGSRRGPVSASTCSHVAESGSS
ncbi:NADH-ubiquinone oxidoreductase-F iron-sulfur binding region domain-containing protein [Streptomyces sp. NPDC088337]|uniref:NADH-ubiquinone oxidoreductase-F iron-sulfur binding region domain-containing protein n=1 Tax=unclassified Streptomyces TaxID=2593676 RepID=UPI002DDA00C9|nr:NADH-ubiquinone oxidoreductase-F iron-sulfur binding region domain-containing protein [Streptomyces sp. NBC_01788]WSB29390.1 hypothetical protein OIE49_27755 [Streptomyces sp. NBC_01788]